MIGFIVDWMIWFAVVRSANHFYKHSVEDRRLLKAIKYIS